MRTRRCMRRSRWVATRRTSSKSPMTTVASQARRISPAGRARAREVTAIVRQATEAALSGVISPLPHYRGKPSVLIATVSVAIARELQLSDQEIERIRVAALLHDIGKIAVPEQILEKPSSLTAPEWDSVKQHPRIGQVILDQAGGPARCRQDHPPSPREVRRGRLPAWFARPGYPARVAHRIDRRCLRRDDPGSTVQARDRPRRCACRASSPRRHPIRPRACRHLRAPLRGRAPVADRKLLMARDAGTRRLLRAQRHATA